MLASPRSLSLHLLVLLSISASLSAQAVQVVERPILTTNNSGLEYDLSYDVARECVVLQTSQGATWEWAGRSWSRRENPGPGANVRLAYDRSAQRTLAVDQGGTWSWDGEDWTQVSGTVGGYFNAGMAYDSRRDRTVSFGGWCGSFGPCTGLETFEFDGAAWSQVGLAGGPGDWYGRCMAYDSARGVVVLSQGPNTWEWDGTNWSSRVAANSPPAATQGLGMAYDTRRGVCVLPLGQEVWEWDGSTWTRIPTAESVNAPCTYDEARGEVIAVAGTNLNSSSSSDATTTWAWTGSRWDLRASTPAGHRYGAAMATDRSRGVVVRHGGYLPVNSFPGTPFPTNQTAEWSGVEWVLAHPATVPPARLGVRMFYDSTRRRVMLYGGDGQNDMWSWDGRDWSAVPTASAPPARPAMGVTFDERRGRAVFFGGGSVRSGGTPWGSVITVWGDTWEWDGVNWTELHPALSPPARLEPFLAYDPIRARTVLFGGTGDSTPSNSSPPVVLTDTWEWDGQQWVELHPITHPPAPFAPGYGACTFDPKRGAVVLYVGAEMWEWDGTNWARIPTAAPLPSFSSSDLVSDPVSGALLVLDQDPTQGYALTRLIGTVTPSSSVPSGAGCAGSLGVPRLLSTFPHLGHTGFRIEANGVAASSPVLLMLSASPGSLPLSGCTLHLGPLLTVIVGVSNGFEVALFPAAIPSDLNFRGLEIHAQVAVLDASVARGFALTNALRLQVGDGE